MFTYNDIGNLFFVIFNNISYNKIEVENIILKKEEFFKHSIEKYIQTSKNFKRRKRP
jgi:hypothetical protein